MRVVFTSLFFFAVLTSFSQTDVAVHQGTLYWIGTASAPIDVRIGGPTGTTYSSIGTNSWYHPDNWSLTSGGVSSVNLIPGKQTNAIFDSNSINDCRIGNANVGGSISANANVCGYTAAACPLTVTLETDFTRTISFASGWELFIQSNGKLEISGGTITGGNDRILLNTGADFILNAGGTFSVPSASKLEIGGGDFVINGGTFNSANATVLISNGTINTNGSALHNLILFGVVSVTGDVTVNNHLCLYNATVNLNNNTITVGGTALSTARTFSMGGASNHADLPTPAESSGASLINNGTIDIVNGHLYLNNTNFQATVSAGTATLKISGTDNQTIEGVPGLFGGTTPQGCLPSLSIDKPSGTLTLQGLINARGGWEHLQGSVDPGTSTVYFRSNSSFSIDIADPTQMKFNNVEINRGIISLANSINIDGNLGIIAGATLTSGLSEDDNIYLAGNFTNAGTFNAAPIGDIFFDGALPQTITFTGTGTLPDTYIESSAILASAITLNGDLFISAGSQLDANTRTLTIKGDWSNSGTFLQGTGTVILNGTTAQHITTIPTSTQSYNTVVINNTAGVTLDAPVMINGNLSLMSGNITSSAANSLTLADGASVSDYSANSYVIGPFRKIGDDYPFTFPVGSVARYAPIRLFDAINALASDEFMVEHLSAPHGNFTLDPGSSLAQVNNQEYWSIDRVAGTVQTKIELSWNLWSSVDWDVNNMVVAHYSEPTDNFWEPAATSFTALGTQTTGTVQTDEVVQSYSDYTTGEEEVVLPVTLTEFRALQLPDGNVKIFWETASEINNDYFIIRKSLNGSTFEVLDSIKGAGTSQQSNQYTFIDEQHFRGTAYYSLTQVDFNGSSETFSLIAHKFNERTSLTDVLAIYPTLITAGESLHLTGCTNLICDQNSCESIRIFTQTGMDITGHCAISAYPQGATIATNNLKQGAYIVQYHDNSIFKVAKFVVK